MPVEVQAAHEHPGHPRHGREHDVLDLPRVCRCISDCRRLWSAVDDLLQPIDMYSMQKTMHAESMSLSNNALRTAADRLIIKQLVAMHSAQQLRSEGSFVRVTSYVCG